MAYFVKVKMLWWKLTSCFMPLWKAHVSGLKFRTSTGTFKELDCRHFRCALKNGNATVQQACKKLMYCFKLVGKLRLRLLHIVRGFSVSSLIIPLSIQRGKTKIRLWRITFKSGLTLLFHLKGFLVPDWQNDLHTSFRQTALLAEILKTHLELRPAKLANKMKCGCVILQSILISRLYMAIISFLI